VTGWTAVAVFTGLMVVALIGFNVRLYRRMQDAVAAGRAKAVAEHAETASQDMQALEVTALQTAPDEPSNERLHA
jgi:hypothetical protein